MFNKNKISVILVCIFYLSFVHGSELTVNIENQKKSGFLFLAIYDDEKAYQEAVLPQAIRARVAVEALHADYWHKFVGLDGRVVGMTSFGESAPGGVLMKEFGFTVENVVAKVLETLG